MEGAMGSFIEQSSCTNGVSGAISRKTKVVPIFERVCFLRFPRNLLSSSASLVVPLIIIGTVLNAWRTPIQSISLNSR